MPAAYTPPPLRRGNRKFTPDADAVEEFIKLLTREPWAIGDETCPTYPEIARISVEYRKDIDANPRAAGRTKARHFAVDSNDNVISNPPKEGGEGIRWCFCLAYVTTPN